MNKATKYTIIETIKKMPNIIEILDIKTKDILLSLHKNSDKNNVKVIVLQYQNAENVSDADLKDAIQRSIQYYQFVSARVAIIMPGPNIPSEDDRVKCFEISMVEAIKKKYYSVMDLKQSRMYNDGIYFLACGYLSRPKNRQYSIPFFKPLS